MGPPPYDFAPGPSFARFITVGSYSDLIETKQS